MWSLEKNATVHVKLSDYGISKFATPQGMLGEEGTPGFQAPEVRAGSTYNEKVCDVVLTLISLRRQRRTSYNKTASGLLFPSVVKPIY